MFERNRIAETLRAAREKQGLSLEQAAAAAGIPLPYVRLLEGESNVRVGISDELYLIPFFRKYALFVGINAEELLPEFLGVVQQIPGEGSPAIALDYRSRWTSLWRPAAVLVTIGVAVALLLRRAPTREPFEDHASSKPPEIVVQSPTAPQATPESAAPTKITGPTDAPTATLPEQTAAPAVAAMSVSTAVAPTSPTPAASATRTHELRIDAKEEAWFALTIADQAAKQYLLRAGESRTWSATYFTLTVGNAGGIIVSLDGRELPAIGRTGQVVRNLRLPAPERTP